MRDARLAELALLSDLDAKNHIRLQFTDGQQTEKLYGLSVSAFKEMLMYMVMQGLINGDTQLTLFGTNGKSVEQATNQYLSQDVDAINRRYELDASMNHRGRLRLQELRDQLRSVRTKEPFGILFSDEYRSRDLEIAFAFLPPKQPLSALFMDLDNFKGVNDKLGHDVGDEVMKRYLQIVRDLTERSGESYRGRGDEVTVILPQCDDARVKDIAETLRKRLESEFVEMKALKTLKKKPTSSIGATTCAATAKPFDVLKFVDAQMYVAKKGGKNRVAWKAYPPSM